MCFFEQFAIVPVLPEPLPALLGRQT